jgi:hypothetical protein
VGTYYSKATCPISCLNVLENIDINFILKYKLCGVPII